MRVDVVWAGEGGCNVDLLDDVALVAVSAAAEAAAVAAAAAAARPIGPEREFRTRGVLGLEPDPDCEQVREADEAVKELGRAIRDVGGDGGVGRVDEDTETGGGLKLHTVWSL